MAVLVLTDDGDTTADRVGAELASRGVPVARVAPEDFPTLLRMDARIESGGSWRGRFTDEYHRTAVDLGEVRSVYYRRPNQFQVDEGMSGPERAFAYGEARRGFGGVLQGLTDCLWVNDPVAAARCEYKPVQLAVASACGLSIPATLITSDPDAAHGWARRLGRPIVYKPLSGVWHADEGRMRVLYTSPVADPAELLDPALSRTAHLLQEQVDKDIEARVLVVGDQVFTASIRVDSAEGRRDWRSDYDSHHYAVIELPPETQTKLVELHRRLGLVFGAVDLIRDPAGRWVFLETNQCGEWGWLAAATDLPIAAALADVLDGSRTWSG